jgi:hypothetical protein
MAADYKSGSDVDTYSGAQFTGLREVWMNKVQGAAASVTNFAHFASRNKILIRAVHIFVRSTASGTAGSMHVVRDTTTIASKVMSSLADSGTYHCITCTTLNTLSTITEVAALRASGNEKGKFDVMYEYQVLYPATFIGD